MKTALRILVATSALVIVEVVVFATALAVLAMDIFLWRPL